MLSGCVNTSFGMLASNSPLPITAVPQPKSTSAPSEKSSSYRILEYGCLYPTNCRRPSTTAFQGLSARKDHTLTETVPASALEKKTHVYLLPHLKTLKYNHASSVTKHLPGCKYPPKRTAARAKHRNYTLNKRKKNVWCLHVALCQDVHLPNLAPTPRIKSRKIAHRGMHISYS